MIDGIIKADGTSRLVRSVSDFKTRFPNYDAFAAALIAGTLPLDILFNAAGWSQIPDFLNKANLLKDTTAEKFGLGADAVPDDAFQAMKNLVSDVAASGLKIATGAFSAVGGSAQTITVGFTPSLVIVVDITNNASYLCRLAVPGAELCFEKAAITTQAQTHLKITSTGFTLQAWAFSSGDAIKYFAVG